MVFIKSLTAQLEEMADDLHEDSKMEDEQMMQQIEQSGESQNLFLQTRMYSLAEVRDNLAEWIPSRASSSH